MSSKLNHVPEKPWDIYWMRHFTRTFSLNREFSKGKLNRYATASLSHGERNYSRFKSTVEVAPDFAVDIPLLWQYIAEVIGAFIGAPTANMSLFKPLMQSIPDDKVEKFFQSVIRFAAEFSVGRDRSSGLSMKENLFFSPKHQSSNSGKHLISLSTTSWKRIRPLAKNTVGCPFHRPRRVDPKLFPQPILN